MRSRYVRERGVRKNTREYAKVREAKMILCTLLSKTSWLTAYRATSHIALPGGGSYRRSAWPIVWSTKERSWGGARPEGPILRLISLFLIFRAFLFERVQGALDGAEVYRTHTHLRTLLLDSPRLRWTRLSSWNVIIDTGVDKTDTQAGFYMISSLNHLWITFVLVAWIMWPGKPSN